MANRNFEPAKDDAIECWLFPGNQNIEDVLILVKSKIGELSEDYIWHKDVFDVSIPLNQSFDRLPAHLYSLTYYGDNIEDEWFIVFILYEISKHLNHLVIQINDSDGEFLLIEAADVLPKWANPDTCENRVFIYQGALHLIPPSLIKTNSVLKVTDSIHFIRSNPEKSVASYEIQKSILDRIEKYTDGAKKSLHNAILSIPIKYAALLESQPQLISHAVNAYCQKDSIESRMCKTLKFDNYIDTTVKFTKCLYAMVKHSNLIFESSWQMPIKGTPQYERKAVGIKVSCGIEILLNQASNNYFQSRSWKVFFDSLKKNGYFKGNLEGSRDYNLLLEKAKQYFIENECLHSRSFIGQKIKEFLESNEFQTKISEIKTRGSKNLIEDGEDWLNINPEDLNEMLCKRYGVPSAFANGDLSAETITDKLSNFLSKTSNIEGVEVGNDDEESDDCVDDDNIDFDCQKFSDTLKNMLNIAIPNDNWNLDSGTDLSEYNSDEETINQDEDFVDKQMKQELADSNVLDSLEKDEHGVNISKNALLNLKQSIKEERASFGPSSNILNSIGINKKLMEELDSNDDY